MIFSCLTIGLQAQTTTDSTVDFWSAVTPTQQHPADPKKVEQLIKWCQQQNLPVDLPCSDGSIWSRQTDAQRGFYPALKSLSTSSRACNEQHLLPVKTRTGEVRDAHYLSRLILQAYFHVSYSEHRTAQQYGQQAVRLADSLQTLQGVTSATLNISSTTAAMSGYTYRVVVSSSTCSAISTVATLTVRSVPDLRPLLYARPALLYGTAPVTVVVDVVEVNGVASSGLITLKITQDNNLTLSLPTDATKIDNRTVDNNAWQLSGPTGGYYILTTNQPIVAGDKLSAGLQGVFNAGASSGSLTVSAVLLGGSGGEQVTNNNNDADKMDYFQQ